MGIDDCTAIWFIQEVGREIHCVDYYENAGEGLRHYLDKLEELRREKGYHYGNHVGPHDLAVREFSTGESRIETARKLGIEFKVCPRPEHKADAIQAARNMLSRCWFDEERCSRGIECLDNYRKEWNDRLGTWNAKPLHDEFSHGADSFQVFAGFAGVNRNRRSVGTVSYGSRRIV